MIILPAIADYTKLSHNYVIFFKLQNNEQKVSKYQGLIILHVATWKRMKESSNNFLLMCSFMPICSLSFQLALESIWSIVLFKPGIGAVSSLCITTTLNTMANEWKYRFETHIVRLAEMLPCEVPETKYWHTANQDGKKCVLFLAF